MNTARNFFMGGLFLLTFFACKSKTKDKEQTIEDKISEITKVDSATEETMLNPKYDESKIRGFGIFKIGASIESTVNELLKSKEYKFDSLASNAKKTKLDLAIQDFTKDNKIYTKKYVVKIDHTKSTFDKYSDDVKNSNWSNDVKNYWITIYTIDNVVIKDLYLTFYKNKLAKISCDRLSTGLEDAIISKFGKADDMTTDIKYYHSYWNNKDIKAGYSSLDYDYDFVVEIKGSDKFLYGCSERAFVEQEKIDKANKKAELGKF